MKLSPKKFLGTKIGLVFFLLILLLFGFNFFKEYNRNRQLDKHLKTLEAMAEGIEAKNLDILKMADYLDTEEFLEYEARTKLGLKKPGEQAVVVNLPGFAKEPTPEQMDEIEEEEFNPYQWWRYFFDN